MLAGVALASAAWLLLPQRATLARKLPAGQALVFDQVLATIRSHYLDTLSEDEMYREAVRGVVDHLADPYSTVLAGTEYTRFQESLTGSSVGVGLEVERVRGAWQLLPPMPGSPAADAGLHAGDRLLGVDGRTISDWPPLRVREALQGPVGTRVSVLVRRASSPQRLVDLIRADVRRPSVGPALLLTHRTGYAALTSVTRTSTSELRGEVRRLIGRGMTRLILDLRQNPGGLVSEGADVAGLFLEQGRLIARLEGRQGDGRTYLAEADSPWPTLPLVVLVDGGTASSAELIAAALQDNDRAVVLGVPSLGKGIVQSTFSLVDGSALRLTSGRWLAPSGRSIQRMAVGRRAFADGQSAAALADTFRSTNGRPLAAHAGVIPDRQVLPVMDSESERTFRVAVARDPSEYRDALAYVASRVDGGRPAGEEQITVSPRMRAMLFQRLQGTKANVPARTFEGARDAVERDLTTAVARRWLGEAGTTRVRLRRDPQVAAALALIAGRMSIGGTGGTRQ